MPYRGLRPWLIFLSLGLIGDSLGASALPPVDESTGPKIKARVQRLLQDEELDRLEQIARQYRNSKARLDSGAWKLPWFYEGTELTFTDETAYLAQIKKLQAWCAAKPDSVTPRIALAECYMSYAWYARSGGWAHQVAPENWKPFHERLKQARAVLDECESMALAQRDPQWFVIRLRLERATAFKQTKMQIRWRYTFLGWPWPRLHPIDVHRTRVFEPLFRRAVAFEREYHGIYQAKATHLLPRWHGKPGELEQFAADAARLTRAFESDGMYTRLVIDAPVDRDENLFEKYRFSWQKTQQGFWDLAAKYPRHATYLTNQCCYVACRAKDRATAATLFSAIGTNIVLAIWRSNETFDQWKQWATGQAERPTFQRKDERKVQTWMRQVKESDKKADWVTSKALNELIVQSRPNAHFHWHNLAFNYYHFKDYTNALAASKRSLEFEKRPERFSLLGAIYLELGDYRAASEATTEAVKLGWEYTSWETLEKCYQNLNDPALARAQLEAILHERPKFVRANELLAKYGRSK